MSNAVVDIDQFLNDFNSEEESANQPQFHTTNVRNGIFGWYCPEEEVDNFFQFLGQGFQLRVHFNQLCNRIYVDSEGNRKECQECGKKTKFKNDKTGEPVLAKASRNFYAPIYLFNAVGRMVTKKNGSGQYADKPEKVLGLKCGEANTAIGLERDRHITNINTANEGGYLLDGIWIARRAKTPEKKARTKLTPVPANPKHKVSESVDEKGKKLIRLVQDLKLPEDVKEKWASTTRAEELGVILNILGNVDWDFFESRGLAVKPVAPEMEHDPDQVIDTNNMDDM